MPSAESMVPDAAHCTVPRRSFADMSGTHSDAEMDDSEDIDRLDEDDERGDDDDDDDGLAPAPRARLKVHLSKKGSNDPSAVCHVCNKRGHCAGFVGSVYVDCPNKPVRW